MLRQVSGQVLPAALSIVGDGSLSQELGTKFGRNPVTVTLGGGRWQVRRPAPEEVAFWKRWQAGRK